MTFFTLHRHWIEFRAEVVMRDLNAAAANVLSEFLIMHDGRSKRASFWDGRHEAKCFTIRDQTPGCGHLSRLFQDLIAPSWNMRTPEGEVREIRFFYDRIEVHCRLGANKDRLKVRLGSALRGFNELFAEADQR